jgi:hypothetical protein
MPDKFCLTPGEFCHPPGAKFRQFRLTTTPELATDKRLAAARWGEIRRITPHEKKEKISLRQKSRTCPETASGSP